MGSKTRGKSGGRRETLPSCTRDYHSVDQLEDDIFGLGYDVALRILLLPLKSIFMLKWVSKRWLAAISDPVFAKLKSTSSVDSISGLLKPYSSFSIRPEQIPLYPRPHIGGKRGHGIHESRRWKSSNIGFSQGPSPRMVVEMGKRNTTLCVTLKPTTMCPSQSLPR